MGQGAPLLARVPAPRHLRQFAFPPRTPVGKGRSHAPISTALTGLVPAGSRAVSDCWLHQNADPAGRQSLCRGLKDKDRAETQAGGLQRFEERALRREEAIKDLDVLKIPTDKVKIVEVEEVSKHEVRAKVEVGSKEAPRSVIYTLTRDPKIQRWSSTMSL